jgi:hypothetical protein
MNNQLKPNSRFSALVEDLKTDKQQDRQQQDRQRENPNDRQHTFKNDNNNNFSRRGSYGRDYNNKEYNEMRDLEKKRLEEAKIKRLEEEKIKTLSKDNFPELCKQEVTSNNKNLSNTFLDKLKIQNNLEKPIEQVVAPGWIKMSRNPLTKETEIIYGKMIHNQDEHNYTEKDVLFNIADNLVNLYETRREEYIELWGYDEWEKTFIFSNYDYEYFDKLDEKYENEMKKIEEMNKNEYDDDYYNEIYSD